MALTAPSLFLFGLQVTTLNRSIDFKAASGGSVLSAQLTLGFYSLADLCTEVTRAMQAADPAHTYTVTADRTVSSGTQNRVTIATSGIFLSLLFSSGPLAGSSAAALLGYTSPDKTGATSYTGTLTAGTVLVTTLTGYNYLSPTQFKKVYGSLNVSATGVKEAIVFQLQQFLQVQFKHEPSVNVLTYWDPLISWLIQQRPFEYTPEVTSPNTFYQCTLEKTGADGKGLGHTWKEELPEFPGLYDSGVLTFRKKV